MSTYYARFILGLIMLEQFSSDAINDYHRQAAEARRTAESTNNPHTMSDFLNFERRWLSLARGFAAEGATTEQASVGW